MRLASRLLAGSALGLTLAFTGAGMASAEEPFAPTDQLTDSADVLSGSEEGTVTDALDQLQSEDGITAYVVYVDSFDDLRPGEWTEQAFTDGGLGGNDVLLAVAVDTSRVGYGAGSAVDADVASIVTNDVEPLLSDQQWATAATTFAQELQPSDTGTYALGGLLGVAVLGAGGYAVVRNRRKKKAVAASQARAAEIAAAEEAARDPHHGTATQDLHYRASAELLSLDEAIKTSQLDVDYARAQYGPGSVTESAAALQESRTELGQAFQIRQELDDDIPEDEPTQRRMLAELLALTGSARARLDQQAAAHRELRHLEEDAPGALDRLDPQIARVQGRIAPTAQVLADLQARYAPSTWRAVADNTGEAEQRVQVAGQALQHGREELAAGRPAGAVPAVRAAEDALAQADRLLAAVDKLQAELASAPERFTAVREETERDIAEAKVLLDRGVDTPGCVSSSPGPSRPWPPRVARRPTATCPTRWRSPGRWTTPTRRSSPRWSPPGTPGSSRSAPSPTWVRRSTPPPARWTRPPTTSPPAAARSGPRRGRGWPRPTGTWTRRTGWPRPRTRSPRCARPSAPSSWGRRP
ncbi:TPM domain-containing protein [Klenkia terrae]|uniref:TPM domain-containing protein n=1 Tax=Klenkia terrae TaxID=1052259 RepID=UPI00361AD9F5